MAEHFSIRSASGRRVSILNPEPEGQQQPHIASPTMEITAGPSAPTVRITRTYRCASCPKVFTSSGHLQRHARVHSGEKQFSCPYPDCNKQCNRQDNLLQHYKIHLPRSERSRGPEYLNLAFAEMTASRALSAVSSSRSRAIPRAEFTTSSTSPVSPVSTLSPVSPVSAYSVIEPQRSQEVMDNEGLHILAASALDDAAMSSMSSDPGDTPTEPTSPDTLVMGSK